MELNRLLITALIFIASCAHAEDKNTINTEEVLSRIEVKSDMSPETTELLGDRIDNNLGALSFYNTDISVPGNSQLEVAIHRSYKGGIFTNKESLELGDWSLDLPHVSSTVPRLYNGNYAGSWGEGNGCMGTPGDEVFDPTTGTNLTATEYWHGDSINVPGKTSEKLLWTNGHFEDFKNDNANSSVEYQRTTKSGWLVKCLLVSEVGDGVQGFEATATDGTTYRFDTLRRQVKSRAKGISRYTFYLLASKVTDRFGNTVNYEYDGTPDTRKLKAIYSSDGRRIDLTYDTSNTQQIISIKTNDRTWTYGYNTLGALTSVTRPDDKAWAYDLYDHEFIRPPTTMDAGGLQDVCKNLNPTQQNKRFVATVTHPNGTQGTFTSKYWLKGRANVVRSKNPDAEGDPYAKKDLINKCFYTTALVSKTLAVPGVANNYQWQYSYGGTEGFYRYQYDGTLIERPTEPSFKPAILQDNNLSILEHNTTVITAPDSAKTYYYHNRDYTSVNDGKLIASEQYDTDGTLLQSTFHQYPELCDDLITTNCEALPQLGFIHMKHENTDPMIYAQQKAKTTIKTYTSAGNVSGTYITESSDYNEFNIPRKTKSYQDGSTDTRYTKKTYQHDKSRWLVNLPLTNQISDVEDEVVEDTEAAEDEDVKTNYTTVSETTYYSTTAANHKASQPYRVYVHGKLIKTYTDYTNISNLNDPTYNDIGSVRNITYNTKIKTDLTTDSASGQFTWYRNYKRGTPSKIYLPKRYSTGSKYISLSVDNNGWVTSGKDFYGTTTSYTYDSMGRLASVNAPSGLADTHISWDDNKLVQTATRCTLSSGNCATDTPLLKSITTYDGLYRPVQTATTDIKNSITIYQKSQFNVYHKPTFKSYPYSTGQSSELGTHSEFDGMQRPTTVTIDGGGSSATEYLSGHQIKTTDFNDNSTTTTYQAYGQPSQDLPIRIASPEGVTTTLGVNVLGNITKITQSGSHKNTTISHSEYRAYDSYNRLCKVSRGDVGTTVYSHYNNGQIAWSAAGVTSTDNTNCTYSNATSNKVSYIYDNNSQPWQTSYADGTNSVNYTYNKNGDLTNLAHGNVTQSYSYNSLRQLTSESLNYNGTTKTFSYGYDTLGHQETITYPPTSIGVNVGTINFKPNAFGQPQQAIGSRGTYASSATYYPTGSLNTFTYGNGITHKTTLNSRNLPSKIHDYKGSIDTVKLSYNYDNQNNVTKITDGVNSQYSITKLTYDGLDRLKSTTGNSGIGHTSLEYDALGNITKYINKTHSLSYSYNLTTNRLNSINDTGSKNRDYNFTNGYEANGNVINDGRQAYSYNLAKHMTQSVKSGSTSSYVYDGHNRRVQATTPSQTERSFYNQAGKLMYREVDKDSATFTYSYIYLGSKLIAKDGFMPHPPQDSTTQHQAFGSTLDAPKDDIGYTGHKQDAASGLVYMQQRYMDPFRAQFLQNDPVSFSNVHNFNRYAYGNNNPYKFVDPDGNNATTLAGTVIGGSIGGPPGALVGAVVGSAIGVVGVLVYNEATGSDKPDFVTDSNGTTVSSDPDKIRESLASIGNEGEPATETQEEGTIHKGVTGNDSEMDVRVMDGQTNGGKFKGPRVITTNSQNNKDPIKTNGEKFRNNESKSTRRQQSHIQLEQEKKV
jgi:RHS repeat-associated protein